MFDKLGEKDFFMFITSSRQAIITQGRKEIVPGAVVCLVRHDTPFQIAFHIESKRAREQERMRVRARKM